MPSNSFFNLRDTVGRAKQGQSESLGERLRRLRRDAGYSLRTLGTEIGISYRLIHYYETEGERIPSDMLERLADAFGVSTDAILGRKGNGKQKTKPRNRYVWNKLKKVETLPAGDRKQILQLIDTLLEKQKLTEQRS